MCGDGGIVLLTTLPTRLRRATSPCTGEAKKKSPPCVKGDVSAYAETGGLSLRLHYQLSSRLHYTPLIAQTPVSKAVP